MLIKIEDIDKRMSKEMRLEMIRVLERLIVDDKLDCGNYRLISFEHDGKVGYLILSVPEFPEKNKNKVKIH